MPVTAGEMLAGVTPATADAPASDTRYAGLAEILFCETGGTCFGGNYSNSLGTDYGRALTDETETVPRPPRKYTTRDRLMDELNGGTGVPPL